MKDLTARRVRTGVVNTAFNLTANGKCMNCLRSVQRGSSRDAFRCKPRTGCRWCGRVTAALSQRHDGSFLRRRLVSGLAGESGAHMHGSLVGVRFGLEYPVHLQALGCAPSCVVTNRTAPAKQWLNKWLYDRNEMKGKKVKWRYSLPPASASLCQLCSCLWTGRCTATACIQTSPSSPSSSSSSSPSAPSSSAAWSRSSPIIILVIIHGHREHYQRHNHHHHHQVVHGLVVDRRRRPSSSSWTVPLTSSPSSSSCSSCRHRRPLTASEGDRWERGQGGGKGGEEGGGTGRERGREGGTEGQLCSALSQLFCSSC